MTTGDGGLLHRGTLARLPTRHLADHLRHSTQTGPVLLARDQDHRRINHEAITDQQTHQAIETDHPRESLLSRGHVPEIQARL